MKQACNKVLKKQLCCARNDAQTIDGLRSITTFSTSKWGTKKSHSTCG